MPLLSKEEKRNSIALPKINQIDSVTQRYGETAIIRGKGRSISGACLKCRNPRCMRFPEAYISCPEFEDFSYERNNNVCPVDAISWDYSKDIPRIDHEKCINCGICALMCPIGAIYSDGNKVYVSEPRNDYSILPVTASNIRLQEELFTRLMTLNWQHRFLHESQSIMSNIYKKVSKFDGRSMSANLLIRNLMIAVGHHCSISRTGDVYTRIDAVYSDGDIYDACYGAMEIEFGRDTLDASRGILDDIAVLHSRNGIDKEKNTALVACLSFPNKRQGYFQVIKDVNKVLNLKIQTVSLGALLILAWNGIEVDFSQKDFYADFDNLSIRSALNNNIKRRVELPEGFLGILEPEK